MANKHLEGHGAPTIETVGYVGQQYTDLDTGDVYNCVGYTTHTIDDYKPTNPHEFVKFNTPTGKVRKYTWQLVPDNANNFGEVNEKFKKIKLSEFENDLFYRKEKVVGSFTMDDFVVNGEGYGVINIEPKIDGLTVNNFEVSVSISMDSGNYVGTFITDKNHSNVTNVGTENFVAEGDVVILHGVHMDDPFGSLDSMVDNNATQIIMPYFENMPIDYCNLELKIVDEKKIPIEYFDTLEIEQELTKILFMGG